MPVFPDLDALSEAAAARFAEEARAAVEARGRFIAALSGGSSPKRLYARLAQPPYRDEIPWAQTHLLFGDERFVSPSDGESNERMAREALIDHVHLAGAHGMVRGDSPEKCADYYDALVRDLLGPDLAIDLTLLGMGPDGHTASLFPGQPSVHERERLVVAAKANMGVPDRITMTAPLLNRSRLVLFLIGGADKAAPLRRVLEGPEDWDETPTQAVARHAPRVEWFLDEAAADGREL
ncbi:MAG: 6-phosphogluconolactonase [Fimbriimonas sp.]